MSCGLLQCPDGRGVVGLRRRRAGLFQHIGLRLANDVQVVLLVVHPTGQIRLLFDIPRRTDDLLLQTGKLLTGAALFLAVLAFSLTLILLILKGLAFSKDLFKVADFGEVHVAGGPARLAVGANVVGPEVVGQ